MTGTPWDELHSEWLARDAERASARERELADMPAGAAAGKEAARRARAKERFDAALAAKAERDKEFGPLSFRVPIGPGMSEPRDSPGKTMARQELIRNPARPNKEIMRIANCAAETVRIERGKLEAAREVHVWRTTGALTPRHVPECWCGQAEAADG